MNKINTMLEKHKLSLRGLARLMGVSHEQIRRWRDGENPLNLSRRIHLNIVDIFLSNAGNQQLQDFCKKMLEI